ncbi:hypothetical protein AB751O23_AV_00060, partial [Chlamydiales bacterium SCGC AB-751-O23]
NNGARVSFVGSTSTFNSLRVEADDGINISGDLETVQGDLLLQGDFDGSMDSFDNILFGSGVTIKSIGDLYLDAENGAIQANGAVSLISDASLYLNENMTSLSTGAVYIEADQDGDGAGNFNLLSSKTLDMGTNSLEIRTNDLILDGSVTSGSTKLLVSDGGTIGVGASTEIDTVAVDFHISKDELSRITATDLQIGDSSSGSIAVDDVESSNSTNISGMLTLDATNANSSIIFENTRSKFNALEAKAGKGIIVDVNLYTLDGDLVLEGDSDNAGDSSDSIQFASGIRLDAEGNVQLDATSGKIHAVDELDVFASDGVLINDSLTTNGYTYLKGGFGNDGIGDFTLSSSASINTQGNELRIKGNDVILNGSISSGELNVTADKNGNGIGDFTLGTSTTLDVGSNILVVKANNLTLNGSVSSGGTVLKADQDLDGIGDFTLGASATLDVVDTNVLTITGNNLTLNGSVTAGVTIIEADSNDDGTGDFTLGTSTTLDVGTNTLDITGNNLTLNGDVLAGTSVFTADQDSDGTGDFTLGTSTTLDVGTNTLDIKGDSITLNGSTTAGITVLEADRNDDGTGDFNLGSSVILDTGVNDLTLTANNITLDGSITTGAAIITADQDQDGTGDFTIASSMSLNTNGNDLLLTANDIHLNGSILAASTQLLVSDGGTIALGDATEVDSTAVGYRLSKEEVSRITATDLQIGDSGSGSIIVDNIAAADSEKIAGLLTLDASNNTANITFENGASTFNTLDVIADDGVIVNADITTLVGDLNIEADIDGSLDTSDALEIGTNISISSAGDLKLDATTGKILGSDGLNLVANETVLLNDNLVISGSLRIESDADDNGTGDFTLLSGTSIDTQGNTLEIRSNDIDLGGSLVASELSLFISDSGDIGIGDYDLDLTKDYVLSKDEIQRITADVLNVGGETAGDIYVKEISEANSATITDLVRIESTGEAGKVIFEGSTSSTFNALEATASDGIEVNVDLYSLIGSLTLEGDSDGTEDTNDNVEIASSTTLISARDVNIDATNGGIVVNDDLTIEANRNINLNDTLHIDSELNLLADQNDSGEGAITTQGDIVTGGNDVKLRSAGLEISNIIDVGAGTLTLESSAGGSIGLGTYSDPGVVFELSNNELELLTASILNVGDSTSGDIFVKGVSSEASTKISGMTNLYASKDGKTVSFLDEDSTFNQLNVVADDGIIITSDLTTLTGDLLLEADNDGFADSLDSIQFSDGISINSAGSLQLDATIGKITGAGDLSLVAANELRINDSITTDGATYIDIQGENELGDLNLISGVNLSTQGHNLEIRANDINLDGLLEASATKLLSSHEGSIGVGAAIGDFTLSKEELSRITATDLQIGDSVSGSITVDDIEELDRANITGTFTLDATGNASSVSFENNSSSFVALDVRADDGVNINVDLATTNGDMKFEADSNNTIDTLDSVQIASGVTLSSTGDMEFDATKGGIEAEGSLNLLVDGNLQVNDSTTFFGTTLVSTDDDTNETGSFTLSEGSVLTVDGADLTIKTQDIILDGSIDVLGGALRLLAQTDSNIGLGSSSSGEFDLSNEELSRVDSLGAVYIGGEYAKAISLGAIVYEAAGDLEIDAGHEEGSIEFINGSSSFESSLILRSPEGLTMNQDVTVKGDLTIFADRNKDGVGDLSVSEGRTLSATTGSLSVDANDVILEGYLKAEEGSITLVPSDGGNIALGGDPSDFSISNEELGRVYAKELILGDNTSGNILVSQIAEEESSFITENITLNASNNGKSVSFTGEASVAAGFAVNADDGIIIEEGLRATVGSIDLNANVDMLSDGNDTITIAGDAGLIANANITLKADEQEITLGKGSILQAGGDITIEDDIASVGPLNILADSNASGEGDFSLSAGEKIDSVDFTLNHLSILSGDIEVGEKTNGEAVLLDREGNEITLLSDTNHSFDKGDVLFSVSNDISFEIPSDANEATLELNNSDADYVEGDTIAYLAYSQNSPEAEGYVIKEVLKSEGESVEIGDILYTLTKDLSYEGFAEGSPEEIDITSERGGILNFLETLIVGGNSMPTTETVKVKVPLLANFTGRFRFDGTLEGAILQPQAESRDFVVGRVTSDVNAESKGEMNLSTEMEEKLNIILGNTIPDPVYDGEGALVEVNYNSISGEFSVGDMFDQGDIKVSAHDINLSGTLEAKEKGDIYISNSSVSAIGIGDVSITDGLTLDNDEMSRLLTNNDLFIGGDTTDSISVSNINYGSSGNLELKATANSGKIELIDEESSFLVSSVNLEANNGIRFYKGLNTTGFVNINTDTDTDGSGDFIIDKNAFLETDGSNLQITSNDIELEVAVEEEDADGYINAGDGDLTLRVSDGGTVGLGESLGKGYTLSNDELKNINTENLDFIGNSSNDIEINSVSSLASQNIDNEFIFKSTSNNARLSFVDGQSNFNNIDIEMSGDLDISANLKTLEGDLNIVSNSASSRQITFNGGYSLVSENDLNITSSSNAAEFTGEFNLEAGNDINLDGDFKETGSGILAFSSNQSFTLSEGSSLSYESVEPPQGSVIAHKDNNEIEINSSEININGKIDTAESFLHISPINADVDIFLGNEGEGLNLSSAEIENITTEKLYIGNDTSGSIFVSDFSGTETSNINEFNLNAVKAGETIEFSEGSFSFNELFSRSDQVLSVLGDITTTKGHLYLTSVNADVIIGESKTLSSGDDLLIVAGENKTIRALGELDLLAVDHIKIRSHLNSLGKTNIMADENDDTIGEINLDKDKRLTTNGYDLHLVGADFVSGGYIDTGAGELKIGATGAGIGLRQSAGQMHISQGELSRLSSSSSLVIGDENTKRVAVGGVTYSGVGDLTFRAGGLGGTVLFEKDPTLIEGPLNVYARDLISIESDVTTDGTVRMDSKVFDIMNPKILDTRGADGLGSNPAYIKGNKLYLMGYILTGEAELVLEGEIVASIEDINNSLDDAAAAAAAEATAASTGSVSVSTLTSSFTGLGSSDQEAGSSDETDEFVEMVERSNLDELMIVMEALNEEFKDLVDKIKFIDVQIAELETKLLRAVDPNEIAQIEGDLAVLRDEKDYLKDEKNDLEDKLDLLENKVGEDDMNDADDEE